MITLAILLLLFAVFVLFRNNWVYKKQTELNRFENGVHIIELYLSYDQMFWRFWIWDVEKLKK